MNENASRLLRFDLEGTRANGTWPVDQAFGLADAARGNPRFLGQVINGGSIPMAPDRVFLVHPIRLNGAEGEGAPGAMVPDSTRTIPVIVIGTSVPSAGDLLLAVSVGGRWVAAFGGFRGSLPCSPCAIPRRPLTLSWTNSQLGTGSTKMVQTSAVRWETGCINQLTFQLTCAGNWILFEASYFLSGNCPSGQRQSCSSPGATPNGLTLDSYSCVPFMLNYRVSSAACPVLWSEGYTRFTITE